jgi:hypothetical protein
MKRYVLPCLCVLLMGYLVSAYLLQRGPFRMHPVACPAEPVAYQVAVDITASNLERENSAQQMGKFVGLLQSCDSVRFWTIDDKTSGNPEFGDKISIPLVDPYVGYGDPQPDLDTVRKTVRDRLNELVAKRSTAQVSDILWISFTTRQPSKPWPRTILGKCSRHKCHRPTEMARD